MVKVFYASLALASIISFFAFRNVAFKGERPLWRNLLSLVLAVMVAAVMGMGFSIVFFELPD